jgi:hypothetical protein
LLASQEGLGSIELAVVGRICHFLDELMYDKLYTRFRSFIVLLVNLYFKHVDYSENKQC